MTDATKTVKELINLFEQRDDVKMEKIQAPRIRFKNSKFGPDSETNDKPEKTEAPRIRLKEFEPKFDTSTCYRATEKVVVGNGAVADLATKFNTPKSETVSTTNGGSKPIKSNVSAINCSKTVSKNKGDQRKFKNEISFTQTGNESKSGQVQTVHTYKSTKDVPIAKTIKTGVKLFGASKSTKECSAIKLTDGNHSESIRKYIFAHQQESSFVTLSRWIFEGDMQPDIFLENGFTNQSLQEAADEVYRIASDNQVPGSQEMILNERIKPGMFIMHNSVLHAQFQVKLNSPQELMSFLRKMTILKCLENSGLFQSFEQFYFAQHTNASGLLHCNAVYLSKFETGFTVTNYKKTYSDEQIIFVAASVVLMLEVLKEFGILHRNIQSSSLLIDSLGYLKLAGFSRACEARQVQPTSMPIEDIYKMSEEDFKEAFGDLVIVAPEVLRGEIYDESVDIWALGYLLHAMALGFQFYSVGTRESVINSILKVDGVYSAISRDLMSFVPGATKNKVCDRTKLEDLRKSKIFEESIFERLQNREVISPLNWKDSDFALC